MQSPFERFTSFSGAHYMGAAAAATTTT